MSNRREFMQMSLAVSALPVLAAPGIAPEEREREPAGLVLAEAASPLASVFRVEAARLGLPVWEIHDDITDLWYQDLWLRWKEAPRILAGVTLSTSLFCIETLARDHQMRVWFRAEHNRSTPGEDWGVRFARFAAGLPLSESALGERASSETAEPGPMVSWVVAPRTKVRFAQSL
jgi:hypothetical protein